MVQGRAVLLAGPQLKKKRTFANENVMIGGATESQENPFEAILDQNQTKIGVALPSDVAQFLANGSRDVFWRRIGHYSDSRYGRMTLATRQILAAAQSSSIVAFFDRRHSFNASMETSRPILFRNLKQSATVFAGVKTRSTAPDTLCCFTPK